MCNGLLMEMVVMRLFLEKGWQLRLKT
jgi:hypothetical protein